MSFTVYKSSAGSGKTFTLVKEYLKLALKDLGQFSKILAVTFTNKAASEMKDRILENLEIISHYTRPEERQTPTVQFLLPELVKETGLSKDDLSKRSEKLLGMILHNFSDFAIGTIDSFVHKIVRTFAQDLKISINFQVELDGPEILSQTIDVLLDKVGHQKDLTDLLIDFIRSKTEEEKSWHIENELNQFAETLLKEDSYVYMEKLRNLSIEDMSSIRKVMGKELKLIDDSFQNDATDIFQTMDQAHLAPTDFYQGERGIYGFIKNLSRKKLSEVNANSYVHKTIDEDKWYSGKATDSAKSAIDSQKEKFILIWERYEAFRSEHWSTYLLKKEAFSKMYSLSVLSEIEKLMHQIKEQQNTLHISEFNKKIADIVFYEPIPFIYERLGERYKNFLIDEFQDTSILQWRNLIPLIDNSLSEGEFNMVVGDGKQAIYRWRNGEVSQFRDLPNIYQNDGSDLMQIREDSLIRNYEEKFLEQNFRSKAELVCFNNEFFDFCKEVLSDVSQKIYDKQAQKYNEKNTGGYIEIQFTEKEDREHLHLDASLRYIQDLLKEGYALSDIAILCRGNKSANLLAAYLLENNISVISEESLLIAPRPKIKLIIGLLNLISDPQNNTFTAEIIVLLSQMWSIQDKISDSLLEYISLKSQSEVKNPSWDYIETFLLERGISISFEEIEQLPLYETVESLVKALQMDHAPNAYLITLMDEVHKFIENQNNSIADFLNYFERKKGSISVNIPEGLDAVRIMTIHKSKGLEFPIVLFPFAWQEERLEIADQWFNWDHIDPNLPVAKIRLRKTLEETSLGPKYLEEQDKSRLDLINIMYVAFTRARTRLYVISSLNSKKEVSISNLLRKFLESKGTYSEEETIYHFGEACFQKEAKGKHILGQAQLNNFICRKGNIEYAETAPKAWATSSSVEAIKRGDLLHDILEHIEYADDLDHILEQALFRGEINDDQIAPFRKLFTTLFEHPEAGEWFSRKVKVYNEQEIIVPARKDDQTSRPELHRPDRIIKSNSKTIVIDYKTGQKSMTHISQILRYKHLLQDMGEKNVKGYLIYLGNQIVVDGPH